MAASTAFAAKASTVMHTLFRKPTRKRDRPALSICSGQSFAASVVTLLLLLEVKLELRSLLGASSKVGTGVARHIIFAMSAAAA
ncbi:MAG: hypothetical protein JWQ72_3100 [Polaromonas sp.]|nr:hypothetical protein [Polaromonas sp.]